MKDLSLHLLDVAKNSVAAGARHVSIALEEDAAGWLTLTISDDGRGMSPEFLAQVTDPFTTTRTTRKVGLGLPLLRLTAEQTGGSLDIQSTVGVGTALTARFAAMDPEGDLLSATPPPGGTRRYPLRSCGTFWAKTSPWQSRRYSPGFRTI